MLRRGREECGRAASPHFVNILNKINKHCLLVILVWEEEREEGEVGGPQRLNMFKY